MDEIRAVVDEAAPARRPAGRRARPGHRGHPQRHPRRRHQHRARLRRRRARPGPGGERGVFVVPTLSTVFAGHRQGHDAGLPLREEDRAGPGSPRRTSRAPSSAGRASRSAPTPASARTARTWRELALPRRPRHVPDGRHRRRHPHGRRAARPRRPDRHPGGRASTADLVVLRRRPAHRHAACSATRPTSCSSSRTAGSQGPAGRARPAGPMTARRVGCLERGGRRPPLRRSAASARR